MTLPRWGRTAGLAALAGLLLLAPACGSRREPAADPGSRAQALIDSGNEAYRQGDYRLAVRRYAAAAVARKDDPAAYYGMGMALAKLGRDEEARSAYARARELAAAKQ
jgi:Flp pilus assembly protein TadD